MSDDLAHDDYAQDKAAQQAALAARREGRATARQGAFAAACARLYGEARPAELPGLGWLWEVPVEVLPAMLTPGASALAFRSWGDEPGLFDRQLLARVVAEVTRVRDRRVRAYVSAERLVLAWEREVAGRTCRGQRAFVAQVPAPRERPAVEDVRAVQLPARPCRAARAA